MTLKNENEKIELSDDDSESEEGHNGNESEESDEFVPGVLDKLSHDLLLDFFSTFFELSEICRTILLVCKEWYNICESDYLWKIHFRKYIGNEIVLLPNNSTITKTIFLKLINRKRNELKKIILGYSRIKINEELCERFFARGFNVLVHDFTFCKKFTRYDHYQGFNVFKKMHKFIDKIIQSNKNNNSIHKKFSYLKKTLYDSFLSESGMKGMFKKMGKEGFLKHDGVRMLRFLCNDLMNSEACKYRNIALATKFEKFLCYYIEYEIFDWFCISASDLLLIVDAVHKLVSMRRKYLRVIFLRRIHDFYVNGKREKILSLIPSFMKYSALVKTGVFDTHYCVYIFFENFHKMKINFGQVLCFLDLNLFEKYFIGKYWRNISLDKQKRKDFMNLFMEDNDFEEGNENVIKSEDSYERKLIIPAIYSYFLTFLYCIDGTEFLECFKYFQKIKRIYENNNRYKGFPKLQPIFSKFLNENMILIHTGTKANTNELFKFVFLYRIFNVHEDKVAHFYSLYHPKKKMFHINFLRNDIEFEMILQFCKKKENKKILLEIKKRCANY